MYATSESRRGARHAQWDVPEPIVDPRTIQEAFSSCSTVSELASATIELIHTVPGCGASSVGLFLPDPAGRLQIAATERSVRSRRLSLSRRQAFLSQQQVHARDPDTNHLALMLPLTTSGRSIGVLEVTGSIDTTDGSLSALDLIASQTASTLTNFLERDALRSESDMLKAAAQLVPELFHSSSMASAVQKAMRACFNWTDGPVAAWLSLATTDELELLNTLGLRASQRQAALDEMRFLSGWKPLRESRLTSAREAFAEFLGVSSVWAIGVEDALILGAGEAHHAQPSLELLRQMLRDLLPHVAKMNRSRQRNLELDLSIASIAHELRGSVLGTKAAIDNALEAAGLPTPEHALLHRSMDELEYLAELTEGLLRWTARGVKLELSPVDVARVVTAAVEASRLKAPDRSVVVNGAVESIVRGNERHLRIVFTNLLRNALTYSPEDAPVTVDIQPRGDLVQVSVRDEGRGIAEQDHEAIFDPWVRGQAGGSSAGRGLGLFISKRIVNAHGGRIWFDSNLDGGTTFHVALFSAQEPVVSGGIVGDRCVY